MRRATILDAPLLDAAAGRDRVLEIGCGTGRLTRQLDARHVVGIDISVAMLRLAQASYLSCALADGGALPFAAASFDAVVVSNGVWRYLDWSRAFAEVARVLRPRGVLAMHDFARDTWTVGAHSNTSSGVREVSCVDELLACAAAAGLGGGDIACFRSVRIAPYLLRIPPWLDRAVPVTLWSHIVAVFHKDSHKDVP